MRSATGRKKGTSSPGKRHRPRPCRATTQTVAAEGVQQEENPTAPTGGGFGSEEALTNFARYLQILREWAEAARGEDDELL